MDQIKSLVEHFGIKCSKVCIIRGTTIKKDGSTTLGFRFTFEKKDFGKFYKYIGFTNKKKQNRLIEALNSSLGS